MSNAVATETKTRQRVPLNGVDTPTLFATIDAVGAARAGKFQFRATNRWMQRHAQPQHASRRSPAPAASIAHMRRRSVRRRPPGRARRRGQRADAGRVPAARASPPASPPASATSPPRAASRSPRSSRRSKATSTCAASSACPNEVRNGYERIRVNFTHQGRRARRRSCGRSSSSPRPLGGVRHAHQRHGRVEVDRRLRHRPDGPGATPAIGPRAAHRHARHRRRPGRAGHEPLPRPTAASTTSSSSAAAWPSAGGASAGIPCGCSRRTG